MFPEYNTKAWVRNSYSFLLLWWFDLHPLHQAADSGSTGIHSQHYSTERRGQLAWLSLTRLEHGDKGSFPSRTDVGQPSNVARGKTSLLCPEAGNWSWQWFHSGTPVSLPGWQILPYSLSILIECLVCFYYLHGEKILSYWDKLGRVG